VAFVKRIAMLWAIGTC